MIRVVLIITINITIIIKASSSIYGGRSLSLTASIRLSTLSSFSLDLVIPRLTAARQRGEELGYCNVSNAVAPPLGLLDSL